MKNELKKVENDNKPIINNNKVDVLPKNPVAANVNLKPVVVDTFPTSFPKFFIRKRVLEALKSLQKQSVIRSQLLILSLVKKLSINHSQNLWTEMREILKE